MIDFSKYIGKRVYVTSTYGYVKLHTVTKENSESLQADGYIPHSTVNGVYYKAFGPNDDIKDAYALWLLTFETSCAFNEPLWWSNERIPIMHIATSGLIHDKYESSITLPLYTNPHATHD